MNGGEQRDDGPLTAVNRFAAHNQSTQPVDNSGEKLGTAGGQPGRGGGERVKSRRRGRGYTQAGQCQGPSRPHPLWTLNPGPTCDDGSCPHDPPHLLLRRCLLCLKSKPLIVGVSAVPTRCHDNGPQACLRQGIIGSVGTCIPQCPDHYTSQRTGGGFR
jgi:hypothetical protein